MLRKRYGLFGMAGLLLLMLLILPASNLYADQPEDNLVMGILPFSPPIKIYRRFLPLFEHLEKHTGAQLGFDTASNFLNFKHETARGKYDIILTAPHFVPHALDSGQYHLQVATTNPLSAVIVTRHDNHINQVLDLEQQIVATPPERAIITIIGKQHLKDLGVTPLHYKTYGSHNNAFHAVLRHKADAAIVSINIYNKARRQNKPLRVLTESREFPGLAILTAKRLPDDVEMKIQQALVSLTDTEQGRKIAREINYTGFQPATPDMFDPFRELLRN